MDCNTQGSLIIHCLLKFAQTHVHWVRDAIQPSLPLLLPSPPDLNLSQQQDLFQRADSSHQVAKVLELQPQHQSFQWVFSLDSLNDWLVWSPCCPRDSQESSLAQKHQSSVFSFLYRPTVISLHAYWKNNSFDFTNLWQQIDVSAL